MQALEVAERGNRWRLEQVVHASEQRLQQLVHETFDQQQKGSGVAWRKGQGLTRAYPDLERSLSPHQRDLVRDGKVDAWDVSLCNSVLRYMRGLEDDENKASAVAAVVAARNHCAHVAGGRVTDADFKHHYASVSRAYEKLGGDVAVMQQIRDRAADVSDANVPSLLTSNEKATHTATLQKSEGNRHFQAGDFNDAKQAYTKGIQLAGAIDSLLLSQLYNNRATCCFHLEDLESAKRDAKRASELVPQWAKPHLRLAEIYHKLFKHTKAVDRLEVALGLAEASRDTAVEREIRKKMPEYRLLRSQDARRESENLAYGPMHSNEGAYLAARQAMQGLQEIQNPNQVVDNMLKLDLFGEVGMNSVKHVMIGHRALQDGRLQDAGREYMAAAIAGNAEGMYNYAVLLLKGQGVRKNIPEAVRWLEKAAAAPVSKVPHENVGIAEAMSSLGNLYDSGVHFNQDKTRAREYWELAAERGGHAGCNNLGMCLMHGTHGMAVDLPKARDYFRLSSELLNNEAMLNIAALYAYLQEYESAVRWADTAAAFGLMPAGDIANRYREMAKMMKHIPVELTDKLHELRSMIGEEPTVERKNRVPSLEELRAIETPYGKRLLSAREKMKAATSRIYPDLDMMVRVVQLAAEAYRIEDSNLVFTSEEMRSASMAADFLLEAGVELNADLALCVGVSDPSSFVSFWKSMQMKFPSDLLITRRAACACMFSAYSGSDTEAAISLFGKALSLLPHSDDDSDPTTMGLLYEAGAAFFQTNHLSRAQSLLSRFLKYAPADGHRKAAEAHFMLGLMAIASATKAPKLRKTKLEAEIRKHLQEGIALQDRLPDFLRENCVSTHRKQLEGFLHAFSTDASLATSATPRSIKQGGELLSGPSRHPKLRSNTSMLVTLWRKNLGKLAEARKNIGASMQSLSNSTVPPRTSIGRASSKSPVPATIDELFSALKDQVYQGRSIECLVVSTSIFTGSSFHMIIEDSQREPARLAVYNATSTLVKQLAPGQAMTLLNPYVRIANDGSIMLRVDNPSETIHLAKKHSICWVCSVEQQPDQRLRSCAKCHKALYCGQKCQKQDWSVDGHRFVCATLKKQ